MYKRMTLEGIVRIPPNQMGNPLKEAVQLALRNKYEAMVDKTLGAIVAILDVSSIGEGRILAGDGAVYYETVFDAIVYRPEMQELIEGEVVEVVKFGAFVSLGPFDGLIHVSQITNEYISYDEKNARLVSKDSNKYLAEGDKVRARIIAVSLNEKEPRASKIGLTMRQTGLGKIEWLESARKSEASVRIKTDHPKAEKPTETADEAEVEQAGPIEIESEPAPKAEGTDVHDDAADVGPEEEVVPQDDAAVPDMPDEEAEQEEDAPPEEDNAEGRDSP
jgi:DNA-directed RNA polymerase subunit E'